MISLDIIKSQAKYFDGKEAFLKAFSKQWKNVKCQVLKYESAKSFCVVENESWEALNKGEWSRAIELIPSSRKNDAPVYKMLAEKGVDFIRCRPIEYPASDYVKWEIQNYFVNSAFGERIFLCNYISIKEFADEFASNDFIVFDGRVSAVHHHNDREELVGGWLVEDSSCILSLMAAFTFIKSQSNPFEALYGNKKDDALDVREALR